MSTGSSDLGSLAQGARQKQLNVARGILLVIGVLTIAVNGFFFTQIQGQVDQSIQAEVQRVQRQGMVVDQAAVAKARESLVRLNTLLTGSALALGVVFVVFGLIVKAFPVPVTVLALVLYVGSAAVFGFFVPESLWQGIILKVIIVIALIKSVQAAVAYQRERGQAFREPSLSPGQPV
jgi:hypothetical protein